MGTHTAVIDNITYLHEQIAAVRANRSSRMDLAVEQTLARVDQSLSVVALELYEVERAGVLDRATLKKIADVVAQLTETFSNVCKQLQEDPGAREV